MMRSLKDLAFLGIAYDFVKFPDAGRPRRKPSAPGKTTIHQSNSSRPSFFCRLGPIAPFVGPCGDYEISKSSGISPNVLRITAASNSPVAGLPRRENAT